MKGSDLDASYMALALRLAKRARGATHPNPMVGAVIVSGRRPYRIVGQGYHRRPGEPHAEVVALRAAGERARGGTLYVTLEPCCHTGKRTPPCVPSILQAGLRRAVVAMPDPNPQVNGRGIEQLRKAGVQVAVGCLREEAERLNEAYSHRMRTGRPFLILKAALTLDGKIATARGESQWITSEPARRHAHRLRSQVDALMVGIGTVLRDDPRLTVRFPGRQLGRPAKQPLRVILDSQLRLPLTAKVLTVKGGETVVMTTSKANPNRIEQLRALGAAVLVLPQRQGRVSLKACLARLGRMDVTTVMLEGGSELNASALREGVVNRVLFYMAPRLLGGQDAKGVIGGRSPAKLALAIPLKDIRVRRIGVDLLIEADLQ